MSQFQPVRIHFLHWTNRSDQLLFFLLEKLNKTTTTKTLLLLLSLWLCFSQHVQHIHTGGWGVGLQPLWIARGATAPLPATLARHSCVRVRERLLRCEALSVCSSFGCGTLTALTRTPAPFSPTYPTTENYF